MILDMVEMPTHVNQDLIIWISNFNYTILEVRHRKPKMF